MRDGAFGDKPARIDKLIRVFGFSEFRGMYSVWWQWRLKPFEVEKIEVTAFWTCQMLIDVCQIWTVQMLIYLQNSYKIKCFVLYMNSLSPSVILIIKEYL